MTQRGPTDREVSSRMCAAAVRTGLRVQIRRGVWWHTDLIFPDQREGVSTSIRRDFQGSGEPVAVASQGLFPQPLWIRYSPTRREMIREFRSLGNGGLGIIAFFRLAKCAVSVGTGARDNNVQQIRRSIKCPLGR